MDTRREVPPALGIDRADVELVLRRGDDGRIHVEVAVVGVGRPCLVEAVSDLALDAGILRLAGVEVHAAAVYHSDRDEVLGIDIEYVYAVGEATVEEFLRIRELVVPHPLGIEVGIRHAPHKHLADERIAEAFARRELDFSFAQEVEGEAGLGDPFRPDVRVVVGTDAGVERQPGADILTEIDVARDFVLRIVDDVGALTALCPRNIFVPSLAPEAVPVEAHGEAVAGEQGRTLIPREAHHVVLGVEPVVERSLALRGDVAIIDFVASPVVEEAQRAGSALVMILKGVGRHAARDALVGIDEGSGDGAGVRGVEVGDVHVAPELPVVGEVVAQFGVAPVLLEAQIDAVAVRAVVGSREGTGEFALLHAVGGFRLEGTVGAGTDIDLRLHAVFLHFSGNNVHHAAHRVRTVEH